MSFKQDLTLYGKKEGPVRMYSLIYLKDPSPHPEVKHTSQAFLYYNPFNGKLLIFFDSEEQNSFCFM